MLQVNCKQGKNNVVPSQYKSAFEHTSNNCYILIYNLCNFILSFYLLTRDKYHSNAEDHQNDDAHQKGTNHRCEVPLGLNRKYTESQTGYAGGADCYHHLKSK